MTITPTHINYYHLCRRKLWLFANGINMEHTSDTVYEGKIIHDSSYPQRATKYTEIDLGVAVIDYYDAERKVIYEIKKSDKVEHAHIAQVKYYIYLLQQRGITGVTALLEYPKLRNCVKPKKCKWYRVKNRKLLFGKMKSSLSLMLIRHRE